ncbi:MAG: hypothetical protein IJ083_18225 [Clostridia bacterium]|nr:hypothetical protein [Clostridia bacterium]
MERFANKHQISMEASCDEVGFLFEDYLAAKDAMKSRALSRSNEACGVPDHICLEALAVKHTNSREAVSSRLLHF